MVAMKTTSRPIYLDYAATTPVDKRVATLMSNYLTSDGEFGNPASQHVYGQYALEAVNEAREKVAHLVGAETSEIIFTSGATESDNLAIKGAAQLYKRKGKHIVTVKTEHKAVLDTCQYLEKHGFSVTYLPVDANGLIDLDEFKASLRDDTILVSVMHVNNETGVMQDLPAIAAETSARGILLHVDAAQGAGKLPLDVRELPVDLISLSGHKCYAPKGVGALYLRKRPRVRIEPLFHGGGHEQGMRSGTLPVHQIVALGEAFSLAAAEREQDFTHVTALNKRLLEIVKPINNLTLHAEHAPRSPYILNLQFNGMVGEAIIEHTPEFVASTASACQGKGAEGSFVLRAMGLNAEEAKSAMRVSFGRFTTMQDVEAAGQSLVRLFS